MSLARASTLVLLVLGCSDAGAPDGGTGEDDGGRAEDAGRMDAGTDVDSGRAEDAGDPDAGIPPDAGSAFRDFLATLDGTVWNGQATRDERGAPVRRAYEMRFVGGGAPMWGEIRNPYGPARRRIRRFVRPDPAGCAGASRCTISTTVSIPDLTWETPPELRGRVERFTLEIIAGSPRALAIRDEASGAEEIFDEGPWPVPTSGLTAEVRVYEGGSGQPVSDAFCTSGGSQDRALVWQFARGLSSEPTLQRDVVAGVPLTTWVDVDNRFGIRDVPGFDIGTLGGSERTDQFYFTVRYTGVVEHPGGRFQMHESQTFDPAMLDDDFEDALFAFVGPSVGGVRHDCGRFTSDPMDLFFEVHGFVWADCTADAPSVTLPAGDVPIEVIGLRCMMSFGSRDLALGLRLGTGPFRFLTDQPTRPVIDETLFPPVL